MHEARKHKRMPVSLSCMLKCKNEPSPVLATVLDVSFGGMGVIASRELFPGDRVEITHSDFPCVAPKSKSSQCRVVSVHPAKGSITERRIGLAFEDPNMEFLQNLLEWVQMQTLVQKLFMHSTRTPDSKPPHPEPVTAQTKTKTEAQHRMIPICCACRKVRSDKGVWQKLKSYVQHGAGAEFSHTICPECRKNLYPELPSTP